MTRTQGNVVTLSFKDWLGLITLVFLITSAILMSWANVIRSIERLEQISYSHEDRINRLETQTYKRN